MASGNTLRAGILIGIVFLQGCQQLGYQTYGYVNASSTIPGTAPLVGAVAKVGSALVCPNPDAAERSAVTYDERGRYPDGRRRQDFLAATSERCVD